MSDISNRGRDSWLLPSDSMPTTPPTNEDYAADIVVAAVIIGIVSEKLWYVELTQNIGRVEHGLTGQHDCDGIQATALPVTITPSSNATALRTSTASNVA